MPNAEMNSWPKKAKVQSNCEILRTIFQPRALSSNIPAIQKRVYLFYNPPNNFSRCTWIVFLYIVWIFLCFFVQNCQPAFLFHRHWLLQKSILLFSMTKQKSSLNACLFLCLYSFKIKSDNFVSVSSNESLKKLLGGLYR